VGAGECALSAAGHRREAGQWRISAATRHDELALRHPEAFAGHAADFRRHAFQAGSAAGPIPSGQRLGVR
jgi:hypothetical protein